MVTWDRDRKENVAHRAEVMADEGVRYEVRQEDNTTDKMMDR